MLATSSFPGGDGGAIRGNKPPCTGGTHRLSLLEQQTHGELMMRLLGRTGLIVFAVCGILGSAIVGPARAAGDPAGTIKNFYATLTQTMERGAQLGDKGRYDTLAPAVRKDFDLGAMAQMAVGPSWARLSPAERQQVTEAFARYTTATYAEHFKAKNERLEVVGTKTMPYGTIVETKIVDAGGSATSVNYLMRQNGGEWQVADIYLQGTISQIANLRSQFSSVVMRGGAKELVETLDRKAASLVPNVAAS
jgi:phospholipid transport system substrate-binding protein